MLSSQRFSIQQIIYKNTMTSPTNKEIPTNIKKEVLPPPTLRRF
jgi:hypothetical protein